MKIIEKNGEIYWGKWPKVPVPQAPATFRLRLDYPGWDTNMKIIGAPEIFRDNIPAVISAEGASFWFISGREKFYRPERMDLRCRAVLWPNLQFINSPVEPISSEVI
jgi:hypothetical protein